MAEKPVKMPDGKPFLFWDDATRYKKIYHVACGDRAASDDNPGTERKPFKTIGRAAQVMRPGEKAVIHGGVYREHVCPMRGGEGPGRMIAYEAAPGERVIVKGSQVWEADFRPSEAWHSDRLPRGVRVYMGDLPPQWFVGFNPFTTSNMSSEYTTFVSDWTKEETLRLLARRGCVFGDGRPLRQVYRFEDLGREAGAFWVEDPGLRLHFRLPGDADPKGVLLEVTTEEQILAPVARGLGYIRVSGLEFEHAADGVPVPQRAAVSTFRGHHWILEDCRIRWANSTGLDVGNETWHAAAKAADLPQGGHIIRRTTVTDCGVCGMAAMGNNKGTLVEDNLIERVGGMDIERIFETGGLKFHTCDTVLIRRNVFRHIHHAPGLWLDYLNVNCRVTENVFADIESLLGGLYLEVSHAPNLIDRNVFWDVRGYPWPNQKEANHTPGINVDTGEECTVAHNFLGRIRDGFGVSVNLNQSGRIVGGRVGLCRRHKVLGNVFAACPKRILFSRTEGNASDGNLFAAGEDAESFCVERPDPRAVLDLAAWQEYYGFDRASREVRLSAEFDVERCVLTLKVEGKLPAGRAAPGPFEIKAGKQTYALRAGVPAQDLTRS